MEYASLVARRKVLFGKCNIMYAEKTVGIWQKQARQMIIFLLFVYS